MKIYNVLDENGRMNKLPKYEISEQSGQYISHTISYLCARKIIANNKPIGLELLIKGDE